MLIELRGALVLVEHGQAQLLHLLEVVVHPELHPEHRVQVVDRRLRTADLGEGGEDLTTALLHYCTTALLQYCTTALLHYCTNKNTEAAWPIC